MTTTEEPVLRPAGVDETAPIRAVGTGRPDG